MGWTGIRHSESLQLAAGGFDAFLTADQNLEHQQNLGALPIAIVVLVVPANRIESLRPLIPASLRTPPSCRRGGRRARSNGGISHCSITSGLCTTFLNYGTTALVAMWLESFKEFPPRQKPASFNLDEVMRKLTEPPGSK